MHNSLYQIVSSILAQSDAAPNVTSAQIESVWDFVLKGGPMMIPIGLCSFVALTVIIERLFSLRRAGVIPSSFLPGLRDAMAGGVDDRSRALAFCEASAAPIAGIFDTAIRRLGESVELLERHIQEAGERTVQRLRKNLRALSVIAAICPLLGLLGTIFGMIEAFQTVASSGEALGKTELLAAGIYEAMITTAAGLLVAIPVMIAYHWISARIDRLVGEIDEMTLAFVEEHVFGVESRDERAIRLRDDSDTSDAPRSLAAASS